MQSTNQQDQTFLAIFQVWELLEVSNRAAYAVLSDHQFQAFPRMNALAKRDIDQGFYLLTRLRRRNGRRDSFAVADGPEIGPRMRNIAVAEIQRAGFPCCLPHAGLISAAFRLR